MRKLIASLGVVCIASAASAQTIDITPMAKIRTDDGSSETNWKVISPSGPSDWFNVDLRGLASGFDAVAILFDGVETGGFAGSMADLSLRTSNANGDPDITVGGLISGQANAPVPAGDGFSDAKGYVVPAVTLGSDVHVAAQWTAGDSHVWIGGDTSGPIANLSHFTINGYATATAPFSAANWAMGVAGFPAGSDGTLLVNGGSSTTIAQNGTVCLTFTACQPNVASALFLNVGFFFGPLAPIPFTITGNPFTGGPLSNQWTLCATTDCNTPTGGPFAFVTIYLDPCQPKPNGKPSAQISTTAFLTINPNKICAGCFGQKDDTILDSTIWKVQNPAGPSDWFNVDHGAPTTKSNVSNITGLEIASWDFCGFGPTWGTVGIFPQVSGSPGVPDIANPFKTVANPTMGPGAGDWTYPATFYDTPDFGASTTTSYHAAVKWPVGDTCIWLASDTDGTDSSCGNPTGTGSTFSYWTLNDYSTGANPFSTANWMMKIDWN